MSADDLNHVADLLGLVYMPDFVSPPTAVRVSEGLKEIAKLQQELRALAQVRRQETNA